MFSNSIIDFFKKLGKRIFFIYKLLFYISFYFFNKLSWLPAHTKENRSFGTLILFAIFQSANFLAFFPLIYDKYPDRLLPTLILFSLINYFLLYYKGKYIKIIDYFEENKPKDIHYLYFFCYIILTFLLFPFMDYIRSILK